jgi:broad specificity phosphatase PhoE
VKIHLLRHGQIVNANLKQADPELSDTGIRQAELLGQRLQSNSLEAIYSSDLQRAQQTTYIVNRYVHTDVVLKPQLREIDMGEIPQKGWGAFPEYYAEWQKHETDLPYPQGEAGQDVQKRAWGVVEEILTRYTQAVALVTHGGVIMVLLSACLGLGQEKRFQFMPMANCSISTLVYDAERHRLKVEQVNDTTHLGSEWLSV